jgi:hypothetical protein
LQDENGKLRQVLSWLSSQKTSARCIGFQL